MVKFFDKVKLDKKIYVIIDEYDNFTNSGTVIDKIFITGVCSISLDAMTCGFNIATNITNDFEFNAMTALTHGEVKELIKEIDEEKQEDIFNAMLDNYNGYKFNEDVDKTVFNPTLVMYYLSNYYEEGEETKELFDSNIISSFTHIKNIITIKNNNYYHDILNNIFEKGYLHGKIVSNFELNKDISYDIIVS